MADTAAAERAYARGEFAAAAAELLPLAEDGDPRAQFLIGRMAFYGQILSQDASVAAHWYRRSADQGFAPAQLAYANALDNGWGVQGDPAQAVHWYRLAALQGERSAMWYLAYHYRRGRGVGYDLVEAWAWYDRLAALGDPDAGRERDWLALVALDDGAAQSARQRSAALAREFDILLSPSGRESPRGETNWRRADAGAAAVRTGDLDLARREWQARAGEGDSMAQLRLAQLYAEGHGVKRDPLLARHWLMHAAEAGEGTAQLALGRLYRFADGVAGDPIEAVKWLALAADRLEDGPERDEALHLRAELEAALSAADREEAQRRIADWSPAVP